jgi:hypothetical protein
MNCLEFRHLILADPYSKDSEAHAHLASCDQCTAFHQEVLDLDGNIEKALMVEVPEGLANRVLLKQSLKPANDSNWRRYGIAASFFAALILGASFLTTSNSNLEAAPMLAHAAHQPHEFYGDEHIPIAGDELEAMMKRLNLSASIGNVVYAAICPIDGERAAHLVIKDGEDQYTVMLLPEHSPSKMYTVDDELWRGYISPHPAGALAVLAGANDKHAIERVREMTSKLQASIYLSAEL